MWEQVKSGVRESRDQVYGVFQHDVSERLNVERQDSLSGTVGAAGSALVRGAARAASVIAATPRAAVTAVALIIVVSGEAARRTPFFGPHLTRG